MCGGSKMWNSRDAIRLSTQDAQRWTRSSSEEPGLSEKRRRNQREKVSRELWLGSRSSFSAIASALGRKIHPEARTGQ